jgi:type IV secretion system protein TrbI
MSNTEQEATSGAGVRPAPEAEMASSFSLRPERPRVTRLSRKALIGGTALALTLISAAVFLALQKREKRAPVTDELYSTDRHNVADKLANLPKDYGSIPPEVPRLGPPLPGDLGRPIVAAHANWSACGRCRAATGQPGE